MLCGFHTTTKASILLVSFDCHCQLRPNVATQADSRTRQIWIRQQLREWFRQFIEFYVIQIWLAKLRRIMNTNAKFVVTPSNFQMEIAMLRHITFGHLVILIVGPTVPKI